MDESQQPLGPSRAQNAPGRLPPRKRAPVQVLVPKKPQARRPSPHPSAQIFVNGAQLAGGASKTLPTLQSRSNSVPADREQSLGLDGEFEEIPILTSKRAFLDGARYHVMRFMPPGGTTQFKIDPTDVSNFTRPVRLHRRDPRSDPSMRWREGSGDGSDEESKANGVEDKDKAKIEAIRAERKAQREAAMAEVAPGTKGPNKRKQNQKKTEQVFQFTELESKEKAKRIRYEEALPWHLEDDDNKNTWSGTYEAALSDCHILLIPEERDGRTFYRMMPVEKWYKFNAKNQFKHLSIEEAEARMAKRMKDPRWFMETQKANEQRQREKAAREVGMRLNIRRGERGEKPGKEEHDEEKPEVAADADDIDYNYDEAFADDEEPGLFGDNDEDAKEADEKIKREMREANVFEIKEEKDFDAEEEKKRQQAEEEKRLAKRVQRALMKREKNYIYEDDSEKNPYSSESESAESGAEVPESSQQTQQETKSSPEKGKTAARDKPATGTSSKGTNTPTGRSKPNDPLRKVLKRPGSPDLSEASGNESSSRKKLKKKHPLPESTSAAGSSISRPVSPANSTTSASALGKPLKLRVGGAQPGKHAHSQAGSGSEGEMSDSTRQKKKIKINTSVNSNRPSPQGSRATSPASAAPEERPPTPNVEELAALIPPEGIAANAFLKKVGSTKKHPQFFGILRRAATMVKDENGDPRLLPLQSKAAS